MPGLLTMSLKCGVLILQEVCGFRCIHRGGIGVCWVHPTKQREVCHDCKLVHVTKGTIKQEKQKHDKNPIVQRSILMWKENIGDNNLSFVHQTFLSKIARVVMLWCLGQQYGFTTIMLLRQQSNGCCDCNCVAATAGANKSMKYHICNNLACAIDTLT